MISFIFYYKLLCPLRLNFYEIHNSSSALYLPDRDYQATFGHETRSGISIKKLDGSSLSLPGLFIRKLI